MAGFDGKVKISTKDYIHPRHYHGSLIRLQPHNDSWFIGQGRTVLRTARDGFVPPDSPYGLFAYETRLLSRYEIHIDGEELIPVASSNVSQHSWLGYYILLPPGTDPGPPDQGSGEVPPYAENTLEVKISRFAGEGLHEDIDLVNYSLKETSFELSFCFDADFASVTEANDKRRMVKRKKTVRWNTPSEGAELYFRHTQSHAYSHSHERGIAKIDRGLRIRISAADPPPKYHKGRITYRVRLASHAKCHFCLDFMPSIDGRVLTPGYSCHSFFGSHNKYDSLRLRFLDSATHFSSPTGKSLTSVVTGCVKQAARDLTALRLYDLDTNENAWTVAAGQPIYVALYGRDTLTVSWQSAILSTAILQGTLPQLARWQGTEVNDWRDEQPGRMIHESHTDPLSALNFIPRGRYYGATTTSAFYSVAVALLWHWTGDKALVTPYLEPALKALKWLNDYGDSNGDGFYDYKTRSKMGVRNQGWKDSSDAIVYPDGKQVSPAIATCEEQAFVYFAKTFFSEVLWWFDRKDEAKQLFREAKDLKKRFNDTFWMDKEGYFAMGLDAKSRPIRSIGSDPGHCIGSGIVDDALVKQTAERMFAPDLFTGWGIRTLSADHPAYDPFSYHRGSVWPVEHGPFALGFARYGLHGHVERICRAQFEAAELFEFYRLPELFSGHPRDNEHPFPAIYPNANSPQAWSASTVFSLLQSMVGVYPYAPLKMLFVDPHLPEWLPEITLSNLRVADAVLTIRFFRKENGSSDYEVQQQEGKLHIVRQPSPWSLTAHFAERMKDILTSFLPSK
ncbi:MAG: glycogen debranching N-terminal domain-containing protein [Candidatus Acidiferrales bacterium]